MSDAITLVPFDDSHLAGAVRLSQQAGWRQRQEDWAFVAALSRGVAAVADGRVVGTALCSEFAMQTAISMVVVDEAFRGRGLGRRLMEAVMAISDGKPMTLSATVEGQPLYESLGFVPIGRIVQMQGIVRQVPPVAAMAMRDATEADLDRMVAMDHDACGADRRPLFQQFLTVGRIFLSESGLVVLRAFGRGEVAGPVIARDGDTARALIAACAVAGQYLRVDTTPETGLESFLRDLGLDHTGGGTAMRHGPPRNAPRDYKTYALASQALG